jgi:hypothetical protein
VTSDEGERFEYRDCFGRGRGADGGEERCDATVGDPTSIGLQGFRVTIEERETAAAVNVDVDEAWDEGLIAEIERLGIRVGRWTVADAFDRAVSQEDPAG